MTSTTPGITPDLPPIDDTLRDALGDDVHQDDAPALSEADGAILDALVDGRFDPEAAPEPCRSHARRVCSLLAELHPTSAGDRGTLADVIMLQIAREERRLRVTASARHELTPQDADALDALVMSGWQHHRIPGSLRDRAGALDTLLGALPGAAPAPAGSLDDRILGAIERHEAEMANRLRLPDRLDPPADIGSGRRFSGRLADIGAAAAVLLVAFSLFGPAVDAGRRVAAQAACTASMGGIGQALASYANSNAESLPLAADQFEQTWWGVGDGVARSNSANLFHLFTTGHRSVDQLACHGNADAAFKASEVGEHDWRTLRQVSFSYRLPVQQNGRLALRSAEAAGFNPAEHPVIADRSPVVLRAVAGEPIDPFASSPNHRERGIGVLFADGAVDRVDGPILDSGDNIWLPRPIEAAIREVARRSGRPITGRELPADGRDAFLGP